MGAAETARAGAVRYRDRVGQAEGQMSSLVADLERCIALVSDNGPMGRSQNTGLVRGRAHLAVAWQRGKDARENAGRSREPVEDLVRRVFPG